MSPFEGTCFKHLGQEKKCSNTHAKAPQYNICNLKVHSVEFWNYRKAKTPEPPEHIRVMPFFSLLSFPFLSSILTASAHTWIKCCRYQGNPEDSLIMSRRTN